MPLELKVDPDRVYGYEDYTSIYVRALGVDGKWGTADIAQLTRESLIKWLRHIEEEEDTLTERVVLVLLDHSPYDNPYE